MKIKITMDGNTQTIEDADLRTLEQLADYGKVRGLRYFARRALEVIHEEGPDFEPFHGLSPGEVLLEVSRC